jgi:formylmethanofuran dehydrogenase subunit E
VDDDGNIHDPTVKQFPSGGVKEFYREFDGTVECEECGKTVSEDDMILMGNYSVCSGSCARRLVGL